MSLVWFDGNLYERGIIDVSPFNRGLTLGDGLFETLLIVDGTALWPDEHLARIEESATKLGLPFPREEFFKAIFGLEVACGKGLHTLRLTLTRGATGRGLGDDGGTPMVLATAGPFDATLIGQRLRLATSSVRRNPTSFASCHKSLSYVDSIVATREAEARNAESALMLNVAGHVASTAIGNLFLLRGDELVTPSLDQGILPGIMRSVILKLGARLGLKVSERAVEPHEILSADAVFQSNSLRVLSPVERLDDQPVGQHDCAFLLKAIADEARNRFGIDIPYSLER
jgi:branched-chain amino acid aminotransferase